MTSPDDKQREATPRTDAALCFAWELDKGCQVVRVGFAHQLERELAYLRDELDEETIRANNAIHAARSASKQTDEKGRPMTYWGGLAAPSSVAAPVPMQVSRYRISLDGLKADKDGDWVSCGDYEALEHLYLQHTNAAPQVSSRTQMPEQSGQRPAVAAPFHYEVTGAAHVVCQCDKCKSASSAIGTSDDAKERTSKNTTTATAIPESDQGDTSAERSAERAAEVDRAMKDAARYRLARSAKFRLIDLWDEEALDAAMQATTDSGAKK